MKSMNDLMLHFLQDIYDAEKKGVRGMAKLAKAAANEELKQALNEHREQSQGQVQRLEQVFEALGKRPRGKTCAAMQGLSEEVDEAIGESDKGAVLDAALIASAQAVDHYEIARYGAMVAWTRQMGLSEAADLLQQTLDEEKASDQRLNEIALNAANKEAEMAGGADEESGEEGEEEGGEGGGARAAGRRASSGARAGASGGRAKASTSGGSRKPAVASSGRGGGAGKKPAARRGATRK